MLEILKKQPVSVGLQVENGDSPNEKAVAMLSGGKVPVVCNINANMLKVGGPAIIHGLHFVFAAA